MRGTSLRQTHRVIRGADLDHVAVAAESQADLWPRYAGDLSGTWGGGGSSPGFNWAQAVFGNGMRVEALEPDRVEQNDFLRRFLDRSGPGPHHLTYKVPSLRTALEVVAASGYRPVGVDESSPNWKEAFIHPKEGPGVVVQLAESAEDELSGPTYARPAVWPAARSGPFDLVHVGHVVADIDEGQRFFVGLLGGEIAGGGVSSDHSWVDITWPGPGRVRLMRPLGPGPMETWLGARRGRVHHLAMTGPEPECIPDAVPDVEAHWVVHPDDNFGTRLVLKRVA